jgi:hypothetical protein
MTSFIHQLQDLVVERLSALKSEEGLAGLQIIPEHKGDLDFQVAERLIKADVGIIVLTPAWQAGDVQDSIQVDVTIGLTLNVTANQGAGGSRRTANEIGELIYGALHGWQPEDQSWTAFDFQSWAPRDLDDARSLLFYTGVYRTSSILTVSNP